MKENKQLLTSLEGLSNKFLKEELYTHYYLSVGKVDEDQLLLEDSNAKKMFFDLSSLTKALVTTPLILSENIKEHDTLADLLRGSENIKKCDPIEYLLDIKIYDLLKHKSGLPAWRNFYTDCSGAQLEYDPSAKHDRMIKTLSRVKVDKTKVGKDCYSDIGMILLGLVLELKYSKNLNELFFSFCKNSLHNETLSKSIQYPASLVGNMNFVSTGNCPVRKIATTGIVHDENCGSLGGVTGHSGVFATGQGLNSYLRFFFRSEIGKKTIQLNSRFIATDNSSLLGLRQGNDSSANVFFDGLTMGHLGFTGTAFWLEPNSGFYAVVLTNRTIYKRLDNRIKSFRREALEILNEAARLSNR